MRTFILLLLAAMAMAQEKPVQPPGETNAISPKGTDPHQPSDSLGPISKETMLTLQLIDAKEQPLREAMQKIADMVFGPTNAQRNAAIVAECAKYKLDANKGECLLNTKTGQVMKDHPAAAEPKK